MLGLGTPELLIIIVLALLLFGAGGVGAAARALGKTRKELSQLSDEIQAPFKEVVTEVRDVTLLDAPPLQVFVSSVMDPQREDLIAERAAAKQAIQEIRITRAWRFEDSPASPDSARWVYLKRVEECDIFVLVLGKEITRPVMREYWRARRNKKPRLVFWKKGERSPAAQAFLNLVRNEVTHKEFETARDLSIETWRAVGTLLINAFRKKLSQNDVVIITSLLAQLPPERVAEERIQVGETNAPNKRDSTELPSVRTGRDGKRMILIPAGWFVMGTSQADAMELQVKFGVLRDYFGREMPQHRVYLDAFYIGETLVTNAEYKRFLDANSRVAIPDDWDKTWRAFPAGKADHPVANVSWQDFGEYASWVGGRLPTEAEWEKAARGTDGRWYPWGNTFPDETRCNFDDPSRGTTPVARYAPRGNSPYGVMDMAGNVWEWCADWYAHDYYKRSPTENPKGPLSGNSRVVRGGAFLNDSWNVRCAVRGDGDPGGRGRRRGFRVVVAPV